MTPGKTQPKVTTHPVVAMSEPHDHTSPTGGPVDFAVQYQAFPPFLRDWKGPLRLAIRQPEPQSNLTLLLLFVGPHTPPAVKWHNIHSWHLKGPTLDFCLKARLTRKLKHPFPIGIWGGKVEISPTRWCLFHFQKQTLKVKPPEPPKPPEPHRIVLPHEVKGMPRVIAPPRTKIILP